MIINFFKKNPGILFSLVLVILIPVLIFLNVFFVISAFQEHIDDGLHSKAVLAQTIFGILASEYIDNPENIQEQIIKIGEIEGGEKIIDIQVIMPEEQEFKIVAAKNQEKIGTIVLVDPTIIFPWHQGRPFANLRMENNERVWFVVDAFYNEKRERVGLISLTLSLAQTDALIHRAIWKSYLILIGTILIVLILIAHHTKLFTYVFLYNKMKEIDEMKDNFIRMATHELQSPIINIRGHLEVLKEELGDSLTDEQEERFKRTDLSAKNLGDLIQDILEVSRLEQGRLDFAHQKISPQTIIQETIEEVKMKAEKKKLFLKTEIQEGPYFISVNANRFRQILINLLENAIKYTPKGEVLVRTRVDEVKNRYLIEVKDTGLGISAESQKRLFERFYRVKTRETADIPGTGLGLWITKQFCEKMGGQIFIESMEGVGTKITIIFPLIKG